MSSSRAASFKDCPVTGGFEFVERSLSPVVLRLHRTYELVLSTCGTTDSLLTIPFNHDLSLGQEGNVGHFVWIEPRTAEVVDGDCAKRSRAQFWGSGPGSRNETNASDTKPKVKWWRCDEASQINSFVSA